MLKTALFFAILVSLVSACKQETIQPATPAPDDEPEAVKCKCKNLIVGYFELEDCQVYICSLPSTPPFSCTGGKLEVSTSFEQNRVTFRSTTWKLCTAPVRLFACVGPCQPLQGYACEAHVFSAALDPLTNELCLEIDDEFLPCAAEEDGGFWFLLATE